MKSHVKVIALDLATYRNAAHPQLIFFRSLPAIEKVAFIRDKIETICTELSRFHAEALWIVGWQEYGVTEATSRFVTRETLGIYKATFLALTRAYPNLVVMAGTLAVKRPFFGKEALKRLKRAEHAFLHQSELMELEMKDADMLNKQTLAALNRIHHLSKKIEAQSDVLEKEIKNENDATFVYQIQNTNYIFYRNEVISHCKKILFEETLDDVALVEHPHYFYHPGASEANHSKFIIVHPITGVPIVCGREICREHATQGVLWKMQGRQPDIHFIFSASTYLFPTHFCGEYVIQFDSLAKTRLIRTEETPSRKLCLELFEWEPFEENQILRGPLKSFFPLEIQIIKYLSQCIFYASSKEERALFSSVLYSHFCGEFSEFRLQSAYTLFETFFNKQLAKYPLGHFSACINSPSWVKKKISAFISSAQNDPQMQLLNSKVSAFVSPSLFAKERMGEMKSATSFSHSIFCLPETHRKESKTIEDPLRSVYRYSEEFLLGLQTRIKMKKGPEASLELFEILQERIPSSFKLKFLETLTLTQLIDAIKHANFSILGWYQAVNVLLIAIEKNELEFSNSFYLDVLANMNLFRSQVSLIKKSVFLSARLDQHIQRVCLCIHTTLKSKTEAEQRQIVLALLDVLNEAHLCQRLLTFFPPSITHSHWIAERMRELSSSITGPSSSSRPLTLTHTK